MKNKLDFIKISRWSRKTIKQFQKQCDVKDSLKMSNIARKYERNLMDG